jgi:hypothetical protein
MTKYSNQTNLGLSFSVKITVSKFKHLSLAKLKEAIPPKYYGDYRYKPKDGEFVPPFRGATSTSILGASPVHVCSCSGRYQFWIRRRKRDVAVTGFGKVDRNSSSFGEISSTVAGLAATRVSRPKPLIHQSRGKGRSA